MSEEQFDFERLKVYQRALEYVDFVYKITKTFPKEEGRDVFFNRSIQKSGNFDMLEYYGGKRWQQN